MDIIVWIIFGGIAGWLASIIMGTNAQQGIIMNVVVGIIGAIIGGWIMSYFGKVEPIVVAGFNMYNLLVAVGGSIILIAILGLIRH